MSPSAPDRPRRPPLSAELPQLVAVAVTQISVPAAAVLSLGTWMMFRRQNQLAPGSLLPLLVFCAWLALGLLVALGLLTGGIACWKAGRFAGPAALSVSLNAGLAIAMIVALIVAGAMGW